MADRSKKLWQLNKSASEDNANGTETNGTKTIARKQSQESRKEELQQTNNKAKGVLKPKTNNNVLPQKSNNNLLITHTTESAISGASYAESSFTSLKLSPVKKLYMNKEKRKMMEIKWAKLHNSSTLSSDSSLDESRSEKTRGRCLRRKSKKEKEIFWKKYNDFLTRSLDCGESSIPTSSDSDKHKYL